MTSDNTIPAILGGLPVRTKPFVVAPMVDQDEETFVLQAIRDGDFSRYVGAGGPNIETTLALTSREAAAVQAPWHFLGGPHVRRFAAEWAEKFSVDFAIPVNAATSGLSAALAAVGAGAGDEVILSPLSFTASGSSPLAFNSIPVFVDVDPRTFCMDPAEVEKAITPRTKAILAIHLLGNACDMHALMRISQRTGIPVVEDAAQAPGVLYRGKPVGTIGHAGVFSLQQSKNIMTGEGGVVTTNLPDVARKVRLIANHGEGVMEDWHTDEQLENVVGFNFRMTELSAALGRAQLKKLDRVNEWRNRNFDILRDLLAETDALIPPHISNEVTYVSHVAGFLFDAERAGMSRDVFLAAVRAEGVPVGSGYTRMMYENPTFLRRIAYGKNGSPWTSHDSSVEYHRGQCPIAESLIYEKFVWMYHIAHPSTEDDMRDVATAILKVLKNADAIAASADTIRSGGDTALRQGRL
ncbi:MAG: DegT/DnrJ/EryC1/StrS family aminotransferase [Alphaproteobacteria bacterium]